MVDRGVFERWISDYLRKSGDDSLDASHNLEVNEHGFLTWHALGEQFWGINVYGDGDYWDAWIIRKAKELGCTKICFLTRRNPEAWKRKYGYELAAYVMEKKV